MEKRRLGKTGQMSTIVVFGGAALWKVSQSEADAAIDLAISHGVNHFDVAPAYGEAEARLGPWMEKHRGEVFLACKTRERSRSRAWDGLKRSLNRLRVDYFDLYQLHAVDDLETLNAATGPGGALEAILQAREEGLVRHIGITGHRSFVLAEALRRFDFSTVLFPLNRGLAAHPNDFNLFNPLLETAHEKDAGIIAIKSVCKRPWETPMHMYRTWYEPFDEQEEIDRSLWYTLTHEVTTAALPGDLRLWPMILDAAERFRPLTPVEQKEAVDAMQCFKPLFPR